MKPARAEPTDTSALPHLPDLELAGACLACGGDLSVRLRDRRAHGVCRGCGGWTTPQVEREPDGLRVRLLAGGSA
jgi:hypothetical protein